MYMLYLPTFENVRDKWYIEAYDVGRHDERLKIMVKFVCVYILISFRTKNQK